jgi:hypothetical protein
MNDWISPPPPSFLGLKMAPRALHIIGKYSISLLIHYLLILQYWGLNSRPSACKTNTLPPEACSQPDFLLFQGWITFHLPLTVFFFNPFISWWTLKLALYLGYKWYCSTWEWVFVILFSVFWIHIQKWHWIKWCICFVFKPSGFP